MVRLLNGRVLVYAPRMNQALDTLKQLVRKNTVKKVFVTTNSATRENARALKNLSKTVSIDGFVVAGPTNRPTNRSNIPTAASTNTNNKDNATIIKLLEKKFLSVYGEPITELDKWFRQRNLGVMRRHVKSVSNLQREARADWQGRPITRQSHKSATPLRFVLKRTMPPEAPFICVLNDNYKEHYFFYDDLFLVVAYAEEVPVAYAVCAWKAQEGTSPRSLYIDLLCSNPKFHVPNAVVELIHYLEDLAVYNDVRLLTLGSLVKPYTFYKRLGFQRSENACTPNTRNTRISQLSRYVNKHYPFYARERTASEIRRQALYDHAALPNNHPGWLYSMSKCLDGVPGGVPRRRS